MTTQIRIVRDTGNKSRFTVFGVRLAYAQDLMQARAGKKDDGTPGVPRYGVTFLIPNAAAEALTEIQRIMWEVAQEKWGAQAQLVWQELAASNRLALKNGAMKASREGFLDNHFIAAGAKVDRPPELFHKWLGQDGRPQKLERPNSVIYSGCYANVQVSMWAQANDYGKRINADVLAVQFAADGPAFAGVGGGADSSVFGGEAPPAGAAFGAPPAAPQMPPQAPAFAPPAASAPPAMPGSFSPPPAMPGAVPGAAAPSQAGAFAPVPF